MISTPRSSAVKVDYRQKLAKLGRRVYKERELWFLSSFAIVWVVIFAYYPMYGLIYAFFDFFPGRTLAESRFVGFEHFIQFFNLPDMLQILRNTLAISTLGLTVGFVAPIILALLFNELSNSLFKRFVQSVSYLPHFISWVVVASIIFSMLGSEGVVNEVLIRMGMIERPIGFLTEGENFWALITGANIWKGVGWGTILYMSAMAGIDPELYQAGAVDGLGRFGMAWHITLPGIRPTILLLFILGAGGLLSAGFEQQLLLGNPLTREYHEVVDTYVFRYGVQLGRFSFATAVGLLRSVLGLMLVLITNALSKRLTDVSII